MTIVLNILVLKITWAILKLPFIFRNTNVL